MSDSLYDGNIFLHTHKRVKKSTNINEQRKNHQKVATTLLKAATFSKLQTKAYNTADEVKAKPCPEVRVLRRPITV
jgi:hypothetical protein